jgi:hypothetical protein
MFGYYDVDQGCNRSSVARVVVSHGRRKRCDVVEGGQKQEKGTVSMIPLICLEFPAYLVSGLYTIKTVARAMPPNIPT